MSKSADFASVAVRLDNLEQIVASGSGSGGGGDGGELKDLVERIYQNTFMCSEYESGPYSSPWSTNLSVFDTTGLSLSCSVWGPWRDGGGAPHSLVNALGDGTFFTSFYSQVFDQKDTRWLQHGGYTGQRPLAEVTYGAHAHEDEDEGFVEVLNTENSNLAAAIFGTPPDLAAVLASSGAASLLSYLQSQIDDLDGRLDILEVKVADLEQWADAVDSTLLNYGLRISALESAS